MLADQDAAVLDQLLSAFLLGGLIVPAAGEGHFHSGSGADGASAQEEGGVAGDNLGIGEGANVAHLGLVSGDLAFRDHLVELHTGGNTGQIAALIDGGESVVIVGQALGVSADTGGVAELDVGELLGGLDHEGLVAKAVGEDDVAALLSQLGGSVVALLAFGNVLLDEVVFILHQAQGLAGFLGGVDEVEVIGGVLIVQGDETHLDLLGLGVVIGLVGAAVGAGHQGQSHDQSQDHCKDFFHVLFFLLLICSVRLKEVRNMPHA